MWSSVKLSVQESVKPLNFVQNYVWKVSENIVDMLYMFDVIKSRKKLISQEYGTREVSIRIICTFSYKKC